MPVTFDLTTVGTDFTSFGGEGAYGGGWILVVNGLCEVRFSHGRTVGQTTPSPTYLLPPGITPFNFGSRPDFFTGFQIRASGGVLSTPQQQFSAALWEPGLIGLTPSNPFPFNTSGGFNPCPCGSGGGQSVETTDGIVDVNPTIILEIGTGIALTEPVVGTAHIENSGVLSVAKSGSAQIVGDVTLSAGTGIALTEVGQNIQIDNTASGAPALDVQTFTAGTAQTWTKPAGSYHMTAMFLFGAGGGGGGGADGSSGAGTSGGTGGGGGAKTVVLFRTDDLPASLSVDVGAGGSAGNGNGDIAATDGGPTRVYASSHVYAFAGGGGAGALGVASNLSGGGGGSMANSASGVTAGAPASAAGVAGIAGQGSTSAVGGNGAATEYGGASGGGCTAGNPGSAGGTSLYGGPGGGSGGGKAAGGTSGQDGGDGGSNFGYTSGGGGAHGAAGNPPVAGTNGTAGNFTVAGTGGGGGGGSTSTAAAGANGGNGGTPAGGGGGAGSTTAGGGFTGGAGGTGGDGRCAIVSW